MTPTCQLSAVIVDDEEALRRTLELLLRQLGIACVGSFSKSEQALAESPVLRPSLIFTDIVRPGMTGLDFARRARSLLPGAVLIFVTGVTDLGAARAAVACGARAYVTKLVAQEELAAAINAALARGLHISKAITGQKPASESSLGTDLAYPGFLTPHAFEKWNPNKAVPGFWPKMAMKAQFKPANLAIEYGRSAPRTRSDWRAVWGMPAREWLARVQIALVQLRLTPSAIIGNLHDQVHLKASSTLRAKFKRYTGQTMRGQRRQLTERSTSQANSGDL